MLTLRLADACGSLPGCSWCDGEEGGVCQAGTLSCLGPRAASQCECSAVQCARLSSCETCAARPGCAWCGTTLNQVSVGRAPHFALRTTHSERAQPNATGRCVAADARGNTCEQCDAVLTAGRCSSLSPFPDAAASPIASFHPNDKLFQPITIDSWSTPSASDCAW